MLPEGAVESVPNVQEMAVNICGIDTPRKVSVCQHVIAKNEPVVFEGLNNHPAPAPVEDLAAAARVDPELASFLTALQASTGFEKRPTDTDDELKNKIVLDFFTKVMSSPESAFYCGVPVRVQGQVVASFCMLAAAKPAAWNDADVSFMEVRIRLPARVVIRTAARATGRDGASPYPHRARIPLSTGAGGAGRGGAREAAERAEDEAGAGGDDEADVRAAAADDAADGRLRRDGGVSACKRGATAESINQR